MKKKKKKEEEEDAFCGGDSRRVLFEPRAEVCVYREGKFLCASESDVHLISDRIETSARKYV